MRRRFGAKRVNWIGRSPPLRLNARSAHIRHGPGTFTTWNGRTVKIYAGYSSPGDAVTGKVIERNGAVAIGCGADMYYPIELQLEGKRRLSVADFVNGYGDFIGAVLGQ